MVGEKPHFEPRTVHRVGVWSLAKIIGLMGILWSLLLVVPVLLIGGVLGVGGTVGQFVVAIVGAGLYGAFGGAITGVIYNLAAEFAGGITLYLEPGDG